MKKIINTENNGNNTTYPLFLGDDLGFADTINVTYPELPLLYEEQRSQFWIETEHSLAQDKIDFKEDPKTGDIMVRNLMSQWLMDSVAARSIMSILEPFASNNECVEILTAWTFYENIHARTYSYIMRECFSDANAVLERAKRDMHVIYRSKIIGKVFSDTNQLAARWVLGEVKATDEVRLQLLKTICAIYALEAISFMASFACTFALTETKRYRGVCNELTAICKDEMLHARFGKAFLNIMINKESDQYRHVFEAHKEELRDIFVETIKQEYSFSEYIFSDGRSTVGINTALLKENVLFLAKPVFDFLGFEIPEEFGKVPTKNPLPYMEKFMNPDSIQSAAQEITLTNYRVGQVVDDASNEIFEF